MATQTRKIGGGRLRTGRLQLQCQNIKAARIGVLLFAAAVWVVSACATTGVTRQEVLSEYDSISQLSSGLEAAEGRGAELLAPEGYEETRKSLSKAIDDAQKGDRAEAEEVAQRGLERLRKLEADMAQARESLNEVITTRHRARNEGAPGLFPDDFVDADKELREAAHLIEKGKRDEALQKRPELIDTYANLELRALKKGTVEAARKAVERAAERDADDLAPETYNAAKQELAMVTTILEADRTQVEKAETHAKRAIWLAQRAIEIAKLVEEFDDEDYSLEGIVLWHQKQLKEAHEPLQGHLPFDRGSEAAVQEMRKDVEALLSTITDMRSTQRDNQQEIAYLQDQLDKKEKQHQEQFAGILEDHRQQLAKLETGGQVEMQAAQRQAQQRVAQLERQMQEEAKKIQDREQRIETVRALFEADGAEVLRQGDEIIVRLPGFDFEPGTSYVGAENFSTLNRILSAVNRFPEADVVVTGHTDSVGSDEKNMVLSLERAENVAKYLTTAGELPPERVDFRGFGETQPVATNDTSEGRAKNRRIEVRIMPNWEAISPETEVVQQRRQEQEQEQEQQPQQEQQ